jgi:endonuclease YncB( thermonuclease family)
MRIAPLLLVLAAAATACTPAAETPSTRPPSPLASEIAVPPAPAGEPIEVLAVLDGDSIEAELAGEVVEVRLLGINTPERSECWSDEAREATAELLAEAEVTLLEAGIDRFGRVLGYLGADGVFVNARLVADGHAAVIANDHPYLDEFLDLEDAAFAAAAGWWGPEACGPDLGTGLRIAALDADPPGRDDDPRDGESVTITNRGTSDVVLEGWVVRDESSIHRYRFPAGVVLAPGGEVLIASVCGFHEHCFDDRDTVWSNGGDTALLLDPAGNVVDRLRFTG